MLLCTDCGNRQQFYGHSNTLPLEWISSLFHKRMLNKFGDKSNACSIMIMIIASTAVESVAVTVDFCNG